MRQAGVVLAAAMVLYSLASGVGERTAVVILLAAVAAHSGGELLQSAGAFGVSYGLAPKRALGEYLGVFGLGIGVCRAVAPGVLAATCLAHGRDGWLVLAALFTLSGLVTPTVVRWAGTDRQGPRDAVGVGPVETTVADETASRTLASGLPDQR